MRKRRVERFQFIERQAELFKSAGDAGRIDLGLDRFDLTQRAERAEFIVALAGLGQALVDQQRVTEAVPLLERALEMSRERFGIDHWRTGEAQLALGMALAASAQPQRAQSMLQEAWAKIEPHRQAQPRLAALAVAALPRDSRQPYVATRER